MKMRFSSVTPSTNAIADIGSINGEPALHTEEDKGFIRSRSSKASKRPGLSRVSKSSEVSSIIDLKKADAAAELAAKEAEFNAMQEQAKFKEDIAKMEAELARRKQELEQIEVKKQMEIARAKLKVYQEVKEFDDDRDEESVEDGPRHIPSIQTEPKITL
ncbi:hypothetical protein AWC38_SpisGene11496 [Stylophora pistillata]|uniref:Uncharacterized protein n=1 Tax=Stylophora pistillata TaxID=50429 RepID=A0A2B4S4F8_STYPI|nr:hypothetical protein AWC38_SpisGene11496 [Stylophora pistillata]